MIKVLFIDNFDSFTFNLVEEFTKRNCEVMVYRNNISLDIIDKAVQRFMPQLIVISPGPSAPSDAGNSMDIIRRYHQTIPIFGDCLGLQCIVEVFGGTVGKAWETIHGKASKIAHDGLTIFNALSNPFLAGRYHSLCALEVPYSLEVSARSESGIVMAVRHKKFFVEGVQFHPESILTPVGGLIIDNLIRQIKKRKSVKNRPSLIGGF